MPSTAPQFSDLATYVGNLIKALVPLSGFITFVMLFVGGFYILTAGSNAETIEKGKKTITYAIVGLTFLVITWLTLKTIAYLTGANILEFKFVL